MAMSPFVTILWYVNIAESDLPSCCRGKVLYIYLSRYFVLNGTKYTGKLVGCGSSVETLW